MKSILVKTIKRVIMPAVLYSFLFQTIFCTDNPVSPSGYPVRDCNCPSPAPYNGPRSAGIVYTYTEIFSSKNEVVNEIASSYDIYGTYPGTGTIYWNGNDKYGNKVPSGYYTVKISYYFSDRSTAICKRMFVDDGSTPPTPTGIQSEIMGRSIIVTCDQIESAYSYIIYYQRISPAVSDTDSVEVFTNRDTLNVYAGSTYVIWMASTYGTDRGARSMPETLMVPYQKPFPVNGIIAYKGDKSALVKWDEDPEAVSYRIYYTDGEKFDTTLYTPADSSPYTLRNLKIGAIYKITVCSVNPAGISPIDTLVTVRPELPLPKIIENVPGDSILILKWDSVPGALKYVVYCDTAINLDTNSNHFSTTTESFTVKSLVPGKTYSFAVTSSDSTSQSVIGNQKRFTAICDPHLIVVQRSGTSAALKWDHQEGAYEYDIYYSKGTVLDTSKTFETVLQRDSTSISSLTPGNPITLGIRIKTSFYKYDGYTMYYSSPIFGPFTFVPRLPAPSISGSSSDKMGIVKIDNPSNAQQFYIYLINSSTKDTITKISTTPVCTLSNLKNRVSYQVYVVYKNDTLLSQPSNTINLYPDYAVPQGLKATAGDGLVTLNWIEIPGVDSYTVSYSKNVYYNEPKKITVVKPPATIRSLQNDTLYYFRVSALSDAESAASDTVSATPFLYSPAALRAFPFENSVELSWNDEVDTLKYNIYWQQGDTITEGESIRIAGVKPPIVVTGLERGRQYSFYITSSGSQESNPSSIASVVTQGSCLDCGMKLITGGTYIMGDDTLTPFSDASPEHTVSVSSFMMDSTEVTIADFASLMGGQKNEAVYTGTKGAAFNMNWYEAVLYCNKRSRRDGLDSVYHYTKVIYSYQRTDRIDSLSGLTADFSKNGYRLPTEAEWEYACRAGSRTKYPWGDTVDNKYANLKLKSAIKYKVAQFLPNQFGLYDMIGNVFEWTNGVHDYDIDNQVDPQEDNGSKATSRGGAALSSESDAANFGTSAARRSYSKNYVPYYNGFRVVRRK